MPDRVLVGAWILLLAVVIVVMPAIPFPFAAVSMGTASPDHLTLTWSEDPQTTVTVTWRTDEGAGEEFVQYAQALEDHPFPYDVRSVTANVQKLSTNAGNMAIHTATLRSLKPGTHYYYRVGYGNLWSEWNPFTTASSLVTNFTFLIFGDSNSSNSSNYRTWGGVLQQAYRTHPQTAFFVHTGNLVDVGQDYMHWNGWLEAAKGVIDRIPVMAVTGTHETYTPDNQIATPTLFTTLVKLPVNGPAGLKGRAYSFDYGEVHFVMLDSQVGEESPSLPDGLEAERRWLEHDLQATNKKWKIAVFHRPPYHNGTSRDDNIRAAFVPLFDKYKVDLAFTGNEAVYARTHPVVDNRLAGEQEWGTVYVASGRSGNQTNKDGAAKEWDALFVNPLKDPVYVAVKVNQSSLTVRAFTPQGEVLDAWSVEKK